MTLHGELLRTDLRIINTGDKPFEFTAALHTYIEVLDIKKASVKGLKDLDYLDKVLPGAHQSAAQECHRHTHAIKLSIPWCRDTS